MDDDDLPAAVPAADAVAGGEPETGVLDSAFDNDPFVVGVVSTVINEE